MRTTMLAAAALTLTAWTFPALAADDGDPVRLGFFTDIQLDAPANGHKYGGVTVDTGPSNHKIPVMAKKAIDAIQPDILFDSGDLTAHSAFEEFRAYHQWAKDQVAPVYPVMGNHDRQHHDPSHPYGTGFYTECNYASAPRTMKMGNFIFILLSEDHKWENHPLTAAISDQKFDWLRKQFRKYATGDNNIFVFEHYPLRNTVAWTDYWYGTNKDRWPTWAETTKTWKSILRKHEEHTVAHISGHVHTNYAWRDTPRDRKLLGYGDGEQGVENAGHFVNGALINAQKREHPPKKLPEMYFLNIQALDYPHGGPWHSEKARPNLTAAVHYADVRPGDRELELIARDIRKQVEMDRYIVRLDHPAKTGKGELTFLESDLGIRKKDDTIQITQHDWFHVPAGKSGQAVFQKRWREPVDLKGLKVQAKNGSHGKVEWKGSSDTGSSWSDWSEEPPTGVDVVQLRIRFTASDGAPMAVRDVKLRTADAAGGS